jgi:hypothetical protein
MTGNAHRPDKSLRRWLESKPVVIAGYFDDVKGANLRYLLTAWVEMGRDSFSDQYPEAADHFMVLVVEKGDPRLDKPGILLQILNDFCDAYHLRVWLEGDLMSESDVQGL